MRSFSGKHSFIKIISCFVICSFLITDLGYCVPTTTAVNVVDKISINSSQIILNPSLIDFPAEHATLREVYKGKGEHLIIHIQDAHANYSGQMSLAMILDHFMKRYGVSLVMSEGSSVDSTLNDLKSISDEKTWKKAAKRFLMENIIKGEEYLNLISSHPMKIMGIENSDLYNESIRAYSKLKDKRKEILFYLHNIKSSLNRIKSKLYPSELLKYERSKENQGSDISFKSTINQALKLAKTLNIPLELHYPEVHKLNLLQGRESLLDFKKVNREQSHLLEQLNAKGFKDDVSIFIKSSKATKNAQTSQYFLLNNIFELARKSGIPSETYSTLADYHTYLQDFLDLNTVVLLDELDLLEDKLYKEILHDNQDARKLRAIDRYVHILEKAYQIQLSSKEFKTLLANEDDFKTLGWQAFLNQRLKDLTYFEDFIPYKSYLEDANSTLKEFYGLVDKRDLHFIEKTNQIMEERKEQIAFLIAGGYHTEHLTQLLRDQDISYIVLTPHVVHETNHEKYEERLLSSLFLGPDHHESSNESRASQSSQHTTLRSELLKPGFFQLAAHLADVGENFFSPSELIRIINALAVQAPIPRAALAERPEDLTLMLSSVGLERVEIEKILDERQKKRNSDDPSGARISREDIEGGLAPSDIHPIVWSGQEFTVYLGGNRNAQESYLSFRIGLRNGQIELLANRKMRSELLFRDSEDITHLVINGQKKVTIKRTDDGVFVYPFNNVETVTYRTLQTRAHAHQMPLSVNQDGLKVDFDLIHDFIVNTQTRQRYLSSRAYIDSVTDRPIKSISFDGHGESNTHSSWIELSSDINQSVLKGKYRGINLGIRITYPDENGRDQVLLVFFDSSIRQSDFLERLLNEVRSDLIFSQPHLSGAGDRRRFSDQYEFTLRESGIADMTYASIPSEAVAVELPYDLDHSQQVTQRTQLLSIELKMVDKTGDELSESEVSRPIDHSSPNDVQTKSTKDRSIAIDAAASQIIGMSREGRKKNANEDVVINEEHDGVRVMGVFDGMGGVRGGKKAAEVTAKSVLSLLKGELDQVLVDDFQQTSLDSLLKRDKYDSVSVGEKDTISVDRVKAKTELEEMYRQLEQELLQVDEVRNKDYESERERKIAVALELGEKTKLSDRLNQLLKLLLVADAESFLKQHQFKSSIQENNLAESMKVSLLLAHLIIETIANREMATGMGTTALMGIYDESDSKLRLGWAGDSRAYAYYKDGTVKQLTSDHSDANDVGYGDFDKVPYIIGSSLSYAVADGLSLPSNFQQTVQTFDLKGKDQDIAQIILVSDGMTKMFQKKALTDRKKYHTIEKVYEEIIASLPDNANSEEISQALTGSALDVFRTLGGKSSFDDTSVVVMNFKENADSKAAARLLNEREGPNNTLMAGSFITRFGLSSGFSTNPDMLNILSNHGQSSGYPFEDIGLLANETVDRKDLIIQLASQADQQTALVVDNNMAFALVDSNAAAVISPHSLNDAVVRQIARQTKNQIAVHARGLREPKTVIAAFYEPSLSGFEAKDLADIQTGFTWNNIENKLSTRVVTFNTNQIPQAGKNEIIVFFADPTSLKEDLKGKINPNSTVIGIESHNQTYFRMGLSISFGFNLGLTDIHSPEDGFRFANQNALIMNTLFGQQRDGKTGDAIYQMKHYTPGQNFLRLIQRGLAYQAVLQGARLVRQTISWAA